MKSIDILSIHSLNDSKSREKTRNPIMDVHSKDLNKSATS